jgi:hypothetical protein
MVSSSTGFSLWLFVRVEFKFHRLKPVLPEILRQFSVGVRALAVAMSSAVVPAQRGGGRSWVA